MKMKGWMMIIVAACFEVVWVTGLKHATSVGEWLITLVAIGVSFYYLIRAGDHMAVGTAYAVFVGLGTVGTTLVGIVYFGEPFRWMTIVLILVLLVGVIGLSLVPSREEKGERL